MSDFYEDKICKIQNVCVDREKTTNIFFYYKEKPFEIAREFLKLNIVPLNKIEFIQLNEKPPSEAKTVEWVKGNENLFFYEDWIPNLYHTFINTYSALFRTLIFTGNIKFDSASGVHYIHKNFTLFNFKSERWFPVPHFYDKNVITFQKNTSKLVCKYFIFNYFYFFYFLFIFIFVFYLFVDLVFFF